MVCNFFWKGNRAAVKGHIRLAKHRTMETEGERLKHHLAGANKARRRLHKAELIPANWYL